jgi:hypothetical protein
MLSLLLPLSQKRKDSLEPTTPFYSKERNLHQASVPQQAEWEGAESRENRKPGYLPNQDIALSRGKARSTEKPEDF